MVMEAEKNSFEKKNKGNRRNKRIKLICLSMVVVLVVAGGGFAWLKNAGKTSAKEGNSNLTYQVNAVTKDDVSVSVSGSGSLTPITSKTVTSSYAGTVEEVLKKTGDTVKAGELIATISSNKLDEELDVLYTSLEDIKTQMASADQTASSKYIKATIAGQVKQIKAEEASIVEDVMDRDGYLCVISTDGKMKLTFSTKEEIKKYDEVTVVIGEEEEDGVITAIHADNATVTIDDNRYTVGDAAKISNSDGTALGEGKMELCEYLPITAEAGVIDTVIRDENDTVSKNSTLFKLTEYPVSEAYLSLQEQKDTLQDQIDTLEEQKYISVDFDGKVTDIQLSVGDSVVEADTICTVSGMDGFNLTVAVDELDIADLSLNQVASITVDAVDGKYEGKVTYISNIGTTNNSVTTYDVIIATENIEGVLSGMNATASITTQSSEDTLIVPVDAVQNSRGESFVYLAPSTAAKGDELESISVDKDSLEKVTVTSGMSDGLYVEISGDIKEGDLILVPVLTTTEEGSSTQEETIKRGMGGFAGEMPSGGQAPSGGGNQGGGSTK